MERVKPQRGGIDIFQMHRTGLSTVLTQGLFPSNFVTTDLDSDARGERKRSVVFNEEVSLIILNIDAFRCVLCECYLSLIFIG